MGVFYEEVLGRNFAKKRNSDGGGCVPGSRDERRSEKLVGFFVWTVVFERKICFSLLGGL